MACIYKKDLVENAYEKHVAESLGISTEQVRMQFVDHPAAVEIAAKFYLDPDILVGQAYDTLFKQLCGQSKLKTTEQKQVMAPLAFVSALAGAYLALMFLQRHMGNCTFNYWRATPWLKPNLRLKQTVKGDPLCECCSNPNYVKIAEKFWSNSK